MPPRGTTTRSGWQRYRRGVRDAGGAQRLSVQARHGMRNAHVSEAIRMMSEATEEALSPSAIARRLGISTRQLERLP